MRFWGRKRTGDVQIQKKNTRNVSYLDIFTLSLISVRQSPRRYQRTLGIPFFFDSIHAQLSIRDYFDSLLKIAQVYHDEKGESEVNFASC